MKNLSLSLIFLCAANFSLAESTLLINVNGYTLTSDREMSSFSALQFTDDRIDRLYLNEEELPTGIETIIDGNGRTLIPGLIDAHGHIESYGSSLLRVDLVGANSEEGSSRAHFGFF